MSMTDTEIASHVVATVNEFRLPLVHEDNPEALFVAQATLITDVAARMAKDETPIKAAQMIANQLHILFDDNPGLQTEFMAEQMRRFTELAERKP